MSYLSDGKNLLLSDKIVFIVEDDAFLGKIYERTLQAIGARVIWAVDGEDGLEKLQLCKPDIIILDIMMPKMNGYEFLRKIRSDSKVKDVPIIAFTNLDAHPEYVNEAGGAGVDEYLIKANTSIEDLVKKIIHHLGVERVDN